MIRRTVGIAHVADLEHQVEGITTKNTRNNDMNNHDYVVISSYLVLVLGRTLICNNNLISDINILNQHVLTTTQHVKSQKGSWSWPFVVE